MQGESVVDDAVEPNSPQASGGEHDKKPLIIKIPPMQPPSDFSPDLRRQTRSAAARSANSAQQHTGSEFSAPTDSNSGSQSDWGPREASGKRNRRSSQVKDVDKQSITQKQNSVEYQTRKGRLTHAPRYNESTDGDEDAGPTTRGKSRRARSTKKAKAKRVLDSDMEAEDDQGTHLEKEAQDIHIIIEDGIQTHSTSNRLSRRITKRDSEQDTYVDEPDAEGSTESDEAFDDPVESSSEPPQDEAPEGNGQRYTLRQRQKVDYAIPPPIEEMRLPSKQGPRRGKGRTGPGWSATGTELSRYINLPAEDSDSDYATRTPRKGLGTGINGGLFAAGSGMFPNDLAAAAGTPSNLGKVTDSMLADADPLGVNQNVTFDEVGGLDDHINSLKEMTLLPLLYPEVFQRFNLTPPRGVLFHGPPGTGKTLLARALAATTRSNGKGISFYMRKGADALSKWVGEAERQLRLLFEEAKNTQPSIIFFDEIDGLAPVRSSKQDQIHASIVSTLLALMDGMDGRGQVIVIGATNRPDAIDPALRRPGRFDREFYFPLPNVAARAKILSIFTKEWEGWQNETASDTIQNLAKVTKGYGGADLRALCTEAALIAVQRRYPQIYKSNDRLLLKPETIFVQPRDFMMSVKKIIPSSARSVAAVAEPLPKQLIPLLGDTLERTKTALGRVLPISKKRSVLEEAEWEDENEEGALEREIMMQSMETMRLYRPRLLLYGTEGMGQSYVAAAALNHLEGFQIQTLDIGTLMGDSTRTAEAGIIQQFTEAKRHPPSVIYIPSLETWCSAMSENARLTVHAMLESLPPNDPILFMAVAHGEYKSLPRDVRSWFGLSSETRIHVIKPGESQRVEFFKELLRDIRRPPPDFPDGVQRKKRILEELPVAPPLEPRKMTSAELAVQEQTDQKVITLLKYRLGPILTELKRRYKRFTKRAADEYNLYTLVSDPIQVGPVQSVTPAILPSNDATVVPTPALNGEVDDIHTHYADEIQLHDIDLEKIHADLYKSKYLTPHEFLVDIAKIVHNATVRAHEDADRLMKANALYTAAEVNINEFDIQFRMECERMAVRERERRILRKEAKLKSKSGDSTSREHSDSTMHAGLRRSARNNGQNPEFSIGDLSQLDKRKRQRSHDINGDSQGSGDEENQTRMAKRSRGGSNVVETPGKDELDIMDVVTSSLPRPAGVRFNLPDDAEGSSVLTTPIQSVIRPLDSLNEDIEQRRSVTINHLLNPMDFQHSYVSEQLNFGAQSEDPPISDQPSSLDTHTPSQATVISVPTLEFKSESFIGGHLPPFAFPYTLNTPSVPLVLETPRRMAPIDVNNAVASDALPLVQATPISPPLMEVDPEVAQNVPSPSPSPSPPPVFHVNDASFAELEKALVEDTHLFNVEQLEQLRATSLSCIWRHRQAWDRDSLMKELLTIVRKFVHEVFQNVQDSEEES